MNFEIAQQNLADFSETGVSAKFDVFFNETKDLVFRVAYHYMRCNSEAEDILQSVFLKIFTYAQEKPKEIQAIKNLKSWLIQIVVNTSKMSIRTKIRQRERNMKKQTEENTFSIEQEDLYRQVTKYLSDLPEKYRLPVCLHYVENMSYAEISTVLNVDQPTVKVQASRGIAKLREIMQKAGIAITPTALSSVLVESSFQKAPANIFFNKNASLKSTRLEQVLDYNIKPSFFATFKITIISIFLFGFLAIYLMFEYKDSEQYKTINDSQKTLQYNFEEKIPREVFLSPNNLNIQKGKGLVFPAQKESTITFPKVLLSEKPISVNCEIYSTFPEPTKIESLFASGIKKVIWRRPAFYRGNDWNHYKVVYIAPYEVAFIKNLPVTIKFIQPDPDIKEGNQILSFNFGNAILKNVTIQTMNQSEVNDLREYISLKANTVDASKIDVNVNELIEYHQNGVFIIPIISKLKKPIEIFIKLKAKTSYFDNIQFYFLDGKESLTIKSYGKFPKSYGTSKDLHFYLFDEICLISKDNEAPSLVFESNSLSLNKTAGFGLDVSLIESIQIIPLSESEIFNQSQKLFKIPSGQIELKLSNLKRND